MRRSRRPERDMEIIVTVHEIYERAEQLMSSDVRVKGAYMGWSSGAGREPGRPATRSDWLLREETGWIYVTGGAIGELSPLRKEDQGKRIEVIGTVEMKEDGIPCLRFKRCVSPPCW